ncbi:MAG: hypothetical protein HY821_11125 [Acidobacteria bacterium]|nr:hypothetical protein [Acidobacteriota bacterium]
MNKRSLWTTAAFVAAAALAAYAVETKTWTLADPADFDKGKLQALALSSDGRLSLAPTWKELQDPAVPHLWSATRDAAGNTYAAGAEGKVFRITPDGKGAAWSTLEGGAIYALAAVKNEVFAAVSPAGKIYRIDASGKPALFSTLQAHYVWALLPAPSGGLFAATGDPGQIQRIDAAGKATVLFDADDTHVRSMALDPQGNLIAGTEPGGVVLRVSPKGEGFVLYQTAKREVTAVAAAPDGTIFAAASGTRSAAAAPATPIIPQVQVQTVQVAGATPAQPQGAAAQAAPRPVAPPPAVAVAPTSAGSEVYSIASDGEPRRIWSHPAVTVYAIALDAAHRPLLGTGNEGRIYRIDSPTTYTRLTDAAPQQITAFAAAASGALIAVTANPGKVYQLGPGLEKSGSFESDALDAGSFTYWGRLRQEAQLNGGTVSLEARSGNLESTQKNWSPWAPVDPSKGGRITAPPARYLAIRATLQAAPAGASPSLSLLEAAYQAKNSAPAIERVEFTQPNHRFASSTSSLTASSSISVPPVGQAARKSSSGAPTPTITENSSISMTGEAGYQGARWRATDLNGDSLLSKVEIRGEGEQQWKLLKEKLKDARYSWDTSTFADGRYRLRVTVSDEEDNYPGQGLTASTESDEFLIDNTPPQIDNLTARIEGNRILIRFHAADALSQLQSAEYSLNGSEWIAVPPTTGITDSPAHDYAVDAPKDAASEFTIAVRVYDERDNVSVRKVTIR